MELSWHWPWAAVAGVIGAIAVIAVLMLVASHAQA